MLPCLLVENKTDLVDEDKIKNDTEIRDFADKNKFIGNFRTSAKQGINISESMEFLIKHIIDKLDNCKFNKNEKDRKNNIVLEKREHTTKTKKDKCC
jgi:50S ribosomal subunit-associated GTPase HflX